MVELPTDTVTFLFTDLEGYTRLLGRHPEAMRGALVRRLRRLRERSLRVCRHQRQLRDDSAALTPSSGGKRSSARHRHDVV